MPNGGAITLNGNESKSLRDILKAKRWCGIYNRKGSKYDVKEVGWNYFMNEFSAAIGLVQLKKIDKFIFCSINMWLSVNLLKFII